MKVWVKAKSSWLPSPKLGEALWSLTDVNPAVKPVAGSKPKTRVPKPRSSAVTAANSGSNYDGAAAAVLMSRRQEPKKKAWNRARIVAVAAAHTATAYPSELGTHRTVSSVWKKFGSVLAGQRRRWSWEVIARHAAHAYARLLETDPMTWSCYG